MIEVSPRDRPRESAVRIALVYPDLLGTYGDGGNAVILAQRLRWRQMPAEVVPVPLGTELPERCDVYVLGGGEDVPQWLAAAELRRSGALARAVEHGAGVLAVCAGLQITGVSGLGADGTTREGVGLADISTLETLAQRAVGELVVDPDPDLGLPGLSGYENHGGLTRLGPGVQPLGVVRSGVGNGASGLDGYVAGRIVGTYLHGPVLARNPELADYVLASVLGSLAEPDPELALADAEAHELRRERLSTHHPRR